MSLKLVDLSVGTKQDDEKLRMDLIAPEQILALAAVYTYGCRKYEDRNWEKGIRWGRVFRAAMSHLWAWWGREDDDKESGMSHLWHAFWNVGALLVYVERGMGDFDDRFHGMDIDGLLAHIESVLRNPLGEQGAKSDKEERGMESSVRSPSALKVIPCCGRPAYASSDKIGLHIVEGESA